MKVSCYSILHKYLIHRFFSPHHCSTEMKVKIAAITFCGFFCDGYVCVCSIIQVPFVEKTTFSLLYLL